MIFEKLIIPVDQVKDINKKTGDQKRSAIIRRVFNQLVYHPIKPDSGIGKTIVKSVEEKGYDDSVNLFLQYAANITKKGNLCNEVSYEHADLIYNLIINRTISKSQIASSVWLYNANAYSGDAFKIKALALLTSKDANKWGDPKTAPIRNILSTNNVDKIKTMLNNWQTGQGVDSVSGKDDDIITLGSFIGYDESDEVEDVVEKLSDIIVYVYGERSHDAENALLDVLQSKYELEYLMDAELKEKTEKYAGRALYSFLKGTMKDKDRESGSRPIKMKSNDMLRIVRDSYERGMSVDDFLSELKKKLGA